MLKVLGQSKEGFFIKILNFKKNIKLILRLLKKYWKCLLNYSYNFGDYKKIKQKIILQIFEFIKKILKKVTELFSYFF